MSRFVLLSALLLAAPYGAAVADPARSGDGVAARAAMSKTSDRTPDNPAPHRTPGASITGAAGTDLARTPFGTSDRTPSNHYRPRLF